MKPVIKLVIAMLPVLLLIGCGSKEVKEQPATTTAPTENNRVVVGGGETTANPAEGEKLPDELNKGSEAGAQTTQEQTAPTDQGKDLLSERKIYFDYDKSDIKDEYKPILMAHAHNLINNPNLTVVIEGHTDERGTREYNMALGERRANAVLQFLILQGVNKNQIRTVSYGEERPDVEGHDESAWKWNRRAVIVYNE